MSTQAIPPPALTPGIDLSHYQGAISGSAIAQSGVKFAYIKATDGATYRDPRRAFNSLVCRASGILDGYYHFLRADVDITQQAANFYAACGENSANLPPALDVEENVNGNQVQSWLHLTEARFNRRPIIYCDPDYAAILARQCPSLAQYDLWIAHYGVETPRIAPWTRWRMWQHTSGGHVPGINTPVDLSWFAGDETELRAWAGLPALPTPPQLESTT